MSEGLILQMTPDLSSKNHMAVILYIKNNRYLRNLINA